MLAKVSGNAIQKKATLIGGFLLPYWLAAAGQKALSQLARSKIVAAALFNSFSDGANSGKIDLKHAGQTY